jgi:hypothetical protein
MNEPVRACLIVDDAPIAAAYWMRLQQLALGYAPNETGWGQRWRELAPAALLPVALLQEFADFVDEFGVRGKFTLLPCPAALGRLDQRVRRFSDAALGEFLEVVRTRLAPRFDITPEVLTHTLALDPQTGTIYPHTETAWLSHLAASGQMAALQEYLRHAWTILRNVDIQPHGLTLGGIEDKSGIAHGKQFGQGDYLREIAEALVVVEGQDSFIFTGSVPRTAAGQQRNSPEIVLETGNGRRVWEIFVLPRDPAFSLLHGDGNLEAAIDALVAPDLDGGQWIEAAEAGRAVVIVTHAQTLNAGNTGMGLAMFREGVRRLRDRYGPRLVWHTADELCHNSQEAKSSTN